MNQENPILMMTAAQQAKLIQFVRVGLKWVTGQMPFEDVVRMFGQPKERSPDRASWIKYTYYPDKVMSVTFIYDKLHLDNGKPRIDGMLLKIGDNVETDIPYETWDTLGLRRLVRGERIDAGRTVEGDYFDPLGLKDVSGKYPLNYVSFGYRLLMPSDTSFDVGAGFGYLGEWVTKSGGATLSNFRNATNLRDLGIGRHYLTPEELKQRDDARRRKYGDMHLCTGMTCPESGIWEPWTSNGPTEAYYLEQGRMFPEAADITMDEAKRQQRYPKMELARWMWVRRDSWFERS